MSNRVVGQLRVHRPFDERLGELFEQAVFSDHGLRVESLALGYFFVAMQADDSSSVEATEKSPLQTSESLRIGKALVRIVSSHFPQTPQDAADTTVVALNCLFGNVANISLSGWDDELKGTIVVKRLQLRVEFPSVKRDACDQKLKSRSLKNAFPCPVSAAKSNDVCLVTASNCGELPGAPRVRNRSSLVGFCGVLARLNVLNPLFNKVFHQVHTHEVTVRALLVP